MSVRTAMPEDAQTTPIPRSWQQLAALLGPFLGLALVVLLFAAQPAIRATFLFLDGFRQVATQTVIVGLGALGMTLIIISGGIDQDAASERVSADGLAGVCAADHHRLGHHRRCGFGPTATSRHGQIACCFPHRSLIPTVD